MKTFLTETRNLEGRLIEGPNIEAFDFGHAEQKAAEIGVTVVGELVLTISREGFTDDDANRMCKALSESNNLENRDEV